MTEISVKDYLENSSSQNSIFVTFPFYFDGKPLDSDKEKHAKWGMTLLKAGSMRFRWNEENENRKKVLKSILTELKKTVCTGNCSSFASECDCKLKPVPLELIHSKDVINVESENDTKNLQGDGIITKNPILVPVITIADCVPIFLYDKENKISGALHSGWKGTGIVKNGIEKMQKIYGSKPENISVAIGPHIGECCYFIDENRAEYFSTNFTKECVSKSAKAPKDFPYKLSLTKANLHVIKSAGIRDENILISTDCTCCSKFNSQENIFGSFRRQAAFLPQEMDSETKSKTMTVQAGFVYFS